MMGCVTAKQTAHCADKLSKTLHPHTKTKPQLPLITSVVLTEGAKSASLGLSAIARSISSSLLLANGTNSSLSSCFFSGLGFLGRGSRFGYKQQCSQNQLTNTAERPDAACNSLAQLFSVICSTIRLQAIAEINIKPLHNRPFLALAPLTLLVASTQAPQSPCHQDQHTQKHQWSSDEQSV